MRIYDAKNNCWISLRETAQYKRKKRLVRDAWILVGIFMIGLPLHGIFTLGLLATCLSFSFLDESAYQID